MDHDTLTEADLAAFDAALAAIAPGYAETAPAAVDRGVITGAPFAQGDVLAVPAGLLPDGARYAPAARRPLGRVEQAVLVTTHAHVLAGEGTTWTTEARTGDTDPGFLGVAHVPDGETATLSHTDEQGHAPVTFGPGVWVLRRYQQPITRRVVPVAEAAPAPRPVTFREAAARQEWGYVPD